MTDKQMEFIVNLIADKIKACKNMEEVRKAIDELLAMVKQDEQE